MIFRAKSILAATVVSVAGSAHAVNMTVVPHDTVVSINSTVTVDLRVENLGAGNAPSLAAYDLDVNSSNPSSVSMDTQTATFGDQLQLSGTSLQQVRPQGSESLRVSEVSLVGAAELNSGQAADFTLFTVDLPTGVLGDAQLFLDNVDLVDASGNPISGVTLSSADIRVELVAEDAGATAEGAEVGHALTNACGDLSGQNPGDLTDGERGLLSTCRTLVDLPAEERAQLVNESVPLVQKPSTRYAIEMPHVQFDNVLLRLTELRGGGPAVSAAGMSLHVGGRRLSGADLQRAMRSVSGGAAGDSIADSGRLGFFINGGLGTGERDTTVRERGFDFDAYGLTFGLDYRFGDNLVLGGALGYGKTEADFDGSPDATDVDGWSAMFYGTWFQSQQFYVDWILNAGKSDFGVSRIDPFSGLIANGDTDGTQYGLSVGGGYDFNQGALTFGPHGRIEYTRVNVDGYRESPVDGNEYIYDDQDATSLRTTLGAQLSYAISSKHGVFLPYGRLDWIHEFDNDSTLVIARFANDPTGTRIALQTDEPDRDYMHLSVGVSAVFAGGTAGFISYEKLLGHSYLDSDWVQMGIRKEF